ncbi:LysM peptidoglycan-binding domain-containing protein [Lentibacillus sp. N15]|uniref:LysM peptidoglycan-binding and 3D domain-containing protein n=1 Tax=Lentibacillus songyuanensis TaxID=3136161 RepID=UPI0031BA3D6A
MKKLLALFAGLMIFSFSAMNVSAAEYEVQKGDTLWDIAINHDTTVEDLMNINGLKSTFIYPKHVLKLHESDIEYYIVQKGDTLSEISETYGDGVTVRKLKAWNDLPSDLITIGQKLIVNGPKTTQQSAEETTNTTDQDVGTESNDVATASKETSKPQKEEQQTHADGRTLSVEATAYTAYCDGCSGVTATGLDLREDPNARVIAVDPNVIPLGSKVYVEGYGYAVAADTGGAINGNRIDVHVTNEDQANNWGRRTVEVTIVE